MIRLLIITEIHDKFSFNFVIWNSTYNTSLLYPKVCGQIMFQHLFLKMNGYKTSDFGGAIIVIMMELIFDVKNYTDKNVM